MILVITSYSMKEIAKEWFVPKTLTDIAWKSLQETKENVIPYYRPLTFLNFLL